MKCNTMKYLLITTCIICFLLSLIPGLNAQTNATWVGGTPGRNTDWSCPSNWKENRIPDEFSQVFIPADCIYYPLIKSGAAPVESMIVAGGAKVTIDKNATLTIIGASGKMFDAAFIGRIINLGSLELEYLQESNIQIDP